MNNQYNAITEQVYHGKNQGILQAVKEKQNYKSDAWLTFVQARAKKLKLVNAKGKGVAIFRGFRTFTKLNKLTGKVETKSGSCGYSYVFNMDLATPFKK